MRKVIFPLLSCFLIAVSAGAQNRIPGQFYSAPLSVNPAFTGLINSDMRAAVSYERFIPRGYTETNTRSASFDMPIMRGVLPKGDAIGVGVNYYQSKENGLGIYKDYFEDNVVSLSLAYHLGLGKSGRHHLSLGAQTVYNTFSRPLYPWHSPGANENVEGAGIDYNWGVAYSGALSAKTSLYGGIARYYKAGIYTSERYIAYLGSTFTLGKRTLLFCSIVYPLRLYGKEGNIYTRFLLNSGRKSASKYDIALYTGFIVRWHDALLPYLGFEAAHMRIGFSVDTRNFGESGYPSGSYQVSLMYTGGLGKLLGKSQATNWSCPVMY